MAALANQMYEKPSMEQKRLKVMLLWAESQ
jgi:hypothetical protein